MEKRPLANNGDLCDSVEKSTTTSFENVLDILGMPGRFQITQLALGINAQLILAFMAMSYVFLGFAPDHSCKPVNETALLSKYEQQIPINQSASASVRYDSCDIRIMVNQSGEVRQVASTSCPEGRTFYGKKHTTWLSEWDLVCESKGIAELSFTCFNAGLIVGGLVASSLADRFGRKPVMVVCAFFCSFWEALIIFLPNILYITVVRFISGIFRQGLINTYYVIGLELLTPKHRDRYGVTIGMTWVFDILATGLAAFILQDRDWRYYQAVVAASGLFFILYPIFIKESPRWLTANGRFDEAVEVLKKASDQNNVDFDSVKSTYEKFISHHHNNKMNGATTLTVGCEQNMPLTAVKDSIEDENDFQRNEKPGRDSLLTLFRHKDLIILTLASWFIWFAHNLTYYGLYMVSTTLSGNRFINFSLMALVEIPSALMILYMMRIMGRVKVVRIFLSLAALVLFTSTMLTTFGKHLPHSSSVITVLFIVGKLAITSSYTVMYILTPEIFPTNLRAAGSASCDSVSRAGAMLVPFLRPLSTEVKWGPGVIFTALCGVALALTVFLPETKNKALLDTVEDLRNSLPQKHQGGDDVKPKAPPSPANRV